MQIKLGEKIKSLRKRDGRRQDDLAAALGVTNQAVSRWEQNKGYPDIEMIPAIANYFHVSIDELFGYDNDRETRLSAYLDEFQRMREIKIDGEEFNTTFEEQEEFLRRALSEFPNEWQLQMRLAWVLESKAVKSTAEERKTILTEAEELLEQARESTSNARWRDSITKSIANNCKMLGDAEKIQQLAAESAPVDISREVLRTYTPDAAKKERYFAEAILALLHELTWAVDWNWTGDDDPEAFIALAEFYKKLFCDGHFGMFHNDLCSLYLRAATVCVKKGDGEKALSYFDTAVTHDLAYREAWNRKEGKPTAPLLCRAVELPSRYIMRNGSFYKNLLSTLPEEIANAIRGNPKYASIFEE